MRDCYQWIQNGAQWPGSTIWKTGLAVGKDGFPEKTSKDCVNLRTSRKSCGIMRSLLFIQYVIRYEEDEDPVCKEILERLSKIINGKIGREKTLLLDHCDLRRRSRMR